jgi:DNA-binding HxlR family transcriptional regulator
MSVGGFSHRALPGGGCVATWSCPLVEQLAQGADVPSPQMSRSDIFLADCPARTTLALVGDTWSVVVIMALGERPRRYTELLARIGGISKKMLTQTLRKLEDNALIERDAPTYRLTELGSSLLDVVRVLAGWAEEHTDALLDAQATGV